MLTKAGTLSVVALAVALLSGCASVAAETRISSALSASEYNDVASRYMERPTFVSIQEFSDGETSLRVEMDEYGDGYDPNLKITTPHYTFFAKKNVPAYLALIDKYLEWEVLASQRGDLIERLIGEAKTRAGGGEMNLKFEFFSSGAANHMLILSLCAFGTCVDETGFTKSNVIILRGLLVDFESGKVGQKNLDGVYK